MNFESAIASTQTLCTAHTCRVACALQVIDELLRLQDIVHSEAVDSLLDLRLLLRRREDAEGALKLFCELRQTMEDRHYLAFYRLRRWFENQVEVSVRLSSAIDDRCAALKLNWHSMDSIRFQCWQSVRQSGECALAPEVRFSFRKTDEFGAREFAGTAPAIADAACLA